MTKEKRTLDQVLSDLNSLLIDENVYLILAINDRLNNLRRRSPLYENELSSIDFQCNRLVEIMNLLKEINVLKFSHDYDEKSDY